MKKKELNQEVLEQLERIQEAIDTSQVEDVRGYAWVLKSVLAHSYNITLSEFHCQIRIQEYVRPRQMFIYIIKKMFPTYSLKRIGAMAKDKPYDHSTVSHHVTEAEKFLEIEYLYRNILENALMQSISLFKQSQIQQSA